MKHKLRVQFFEADGVYPVSRGGEGPIVVIDADCYSDQPMKPHLKKRGFTLIEIMIVVTIIGLLATMANVVFTRINLRARASVFANDCRAFSEAFLHYAQETGDFPADGGPHFVPPVMTAYLNRTQWMRVTPFGGNYDWDNIDSWANFPQRPRAAISVSGCTMTIPQLQQVDRWLDDGNIATGIFRVTDAGATISYIIEP